MACLELQIETGRHTVLKTLENLRICPFCHLNEVELELHFLFNCNLYDSFGSNFYRNITNRYPLVNNNFNNREKTLFIFNNVNPHIYKLTAQGSTLTFQLTGLVATDKLDVTSLEKIFTSQALMLAWSNNSRITSKT